MSRRHNINADIAVAKAVGSALQQQVNAKADAVSLTTSRCGEAMLLLANYMAYRIDILNDEIGDRTPTQFVQKLRNRVNGVTRACDELIRTLEPHMTGPDISERYSWFSEVIFQALDSHTVIMVPHNKATPEYAEQYREKLSKNSYKSIKSTNP